MRRVSNSTAQLTGHATTGRRVTDLVTSVAPPALAQSGATDFGTGGAVVSLGSAVTAGHLLIGMVVTNGGHAANISDSAGNVWAEANHADTPGPARVTVFWAKASTSGSLNITANGSDNQAGLLGYEVSGIASATPLDATAVAASGTSVPVVGPSLSGLAGSTDFVVYWAAYVPASNTPAGGIWTSDFSCLISGQNFLCAAWAVTGPSVTGPVIVPGTNATFAVVAAAFKPS